MSEQESWDQYRKLVMSNFEALHAEIKALRDELSKVREETIRMNISIAELKLRAGLWGATASALVAAALYLFNKMGGGH